MITQFYKYLDVEGARLTLRNRTFKHSKPSDFNDTEDLTVQSIFPEAEDTAIQAMKNGFVDVLVRNQDRPATNANVQQRKNTELLKEVCRDPEVAERLRRATQEDRIDEFCDLPHLREFNRSFLRDLNEFLQGYRVFCVSEVIDSTRMWALYGQNHQGIALRILPNLAKDSKFSQFRKVHYREKRPSLYTNAVNFLESAMFGDQQRDRQVMLDTIIYTKTLAWEHEKEHRLVIPVLNERDWNVMPYHPEEIVELYLGARMDEQTRNELIELAQALNPAIAIFRCILDQAEKISFRLEWGAL